MTDFDNELERIEKGDAWDESDEVVKMEAKRPLDKVIPIRLPSAVWERLRQEAKEMGIGPTTLARMWILERLRFKDLADQDESKFTNYIIRDARQENVVLMKKVGEVKNKIMSDNWNKNDVKILADCLNKLPPVNKQNNIIFLTAPEKLLDCVLSLNRRYKEFDVPRVIKFKNNHPQINTLIDLQDCVNRYGGPVNFYKNVLDYNHEPAAKMFGRVLDYLILQTHKYPGSNDIEKLMVWAKSSEIDGYNKIWGEGPNITNIPGFGIAGWQYLRMLFGADTCKPDIAVRRFIADCLGRQLSEYSIVKILEASAPISENLQNHEKPVREADRRIWNQYNEKNKQRKYSCH